MKDFTKGNPTKQLIDFSLPLLLGTIIQQLYNTTDAIIVGRYLGGTALAAVGSAGFIVNFMLAVIMGLAMGSSVLVSQLYGAKNWIELKRAVTTIAVFMTLVIAFISIVGFIATKPFLRILDTPPDILDEMAEYLSVLLATLIFPMYYNLFSSLLRALGESKYPTYILIGTTIANVFLDLMFVLWLKQGVLGVAYATAISQAISALLCYLYILRSMPELKISSLTVDKRMLMQTLRYSIPASIQLSLTSLASLLILRLVNSFGALAVAGYSAAVKADQLAIVPLNSIGLAISTFVAQNMGAGLEKRAKQGLRSGMFLMVAVGVIISAIVILLRKPFVSLFIEMEAEDAAVILRTGTSYLSILCFFYVLFAVFFAFNGFFRGVGDAVVVMALTVSSLTIRNICANLFVAFTGMQLEAVAWSIPVGWGLCDLFCLWYFLRRKWAGKMAVK
jgi:putative MATE family efflux protein